MSWYLLPSGMPFFTVDGTNLAARLLAEHATVLDEEDVQDAIDAWNARVPGPAGHPADWATQLELIGYRDEAKAARDEAVAVGATNDTIIKGRIDDTASQTRASLNAAFVARGVGFVALRDDGVTPYFDTAGIDFEDAVPVLLRNDGVTPYIETGA